jgi:UDP-N-acetylmuramate dehydrogenase
MNFFIKKNLSLKYYTTINIAGTVKIAFFPQNRQGVLEVFNTLEKTTKLPFFVLGKGSNVAIDDGELDYAAIITNYLDNYTVNTETGEVVVGAGKATSLLAKVLLKEYGLKNLHWAYGLPGSIGGATFMNARAYGFEMADIVDWVEVFDYKQKSFKVITKKDCEYAYKQSIFQTQPYFITNIGLKLERVLEDEKVKLISYMESLREGRLKKGQFIYPSAGSCFKNDYSIGIPSGEIIDSLNLKELSCGGAKISEYHANFFVNASHHASFKDLHYLLDKVQKEVEQKKGYHLKREIFLIPQDLKDFSN